MSAPQAVTQFMLAPLAYDPPVPRWLERVCCPRTGLGHWVVSSISDDMQDGLPVEGYLVNERAGTAYDIREGIPDMTAGLRRSDLTHAGWSNHFPFAPQVYERVWRRRALTLMTGESFPVARELSVLNDWANIQPGESVVDLGTSTGLYARGVAAHVDATVFAIDLSWGMLREAKKYIAREERRGIVLMRAAAERLPFYDEALDAVVVGGSLNEMKSMPVALREARRVTREGGRMFVMGLTRANTRRGRWLQRFLGRGGIHFPTVNTFNSMMREAGWAIQGQHKRGIVLFTLLNKQR